MATTTVSTSSSPKIEEEEEVRDQHKNAECSEFSSLDPSIIIDILARLPVSSILDCKYVCKPWRTLILDPYFAKTYLTRPPITSVVLFIDNSYYLLELGNGYVYTRPSDRPKKFNIHLDVPIETLELVGSCNGLLCFIQNDFGENYLYLSNPILGEYVALSVPKREIMHIRETFGFGFSQASGVYKLVRVVLKRVPSGQHSILSSDGEICTLGSGTWRKVANIPFPLFGKLGDANLNGSLHWIADHFEKPEYLFSFDIEKEELATITPPPGFNNKTIWMGLGVLGNCLCVFDNSWYSHLDVWTMKRYGVAESWTKSSISKTSIPRTSPNSWLWPVTIWKDGEILISSDSGALLSYNPVTKCLQEVEIFGFKPLPNAVSVWQIAAVSFTPNFLSLRDVIGDA